MPVHDVLGSTVNLAKSWLMTLDRKAINTSVPTATLELWLTTLIDLGSPQTEVGTVATRTVMGLTAQVSEAHKAEMEQQTARAATRL